MIIHPLQLLLKMLMPLWLMLLFFWLPASEGKESNEILSNLPEVNRDTSSHANRTEYIPFSVFSDHKIAASARVSNKRLLRIPLPNSNLSSLVCYPGVDKDYRNIYTLSHITCRQMGFMTFTSIRAKMFPLGEARINSKDFICSDALSGASSCKLLQNGTEDCKMVTEVTCGGCNGTIKGFKGAIKSPGFPFASFEDVTCEWNIIVPEHHSIFLSFNQFDAMNMKSADLPCGLHKPYIHVMYGIQSRVTVRRYCRLDEVQNLTIPFHSVKVIVFTGLQSRQETRPSTSNLGISITFEATVSVEESHGSPLKMLAFFLLGVIFIACLILCHYIQKHKLCDCIVKDRDKRFLSHPMEQAYDLHNCNMTRNQNLNLNKCAREEGTRMGRVEFQQDSKTAATSIQVCLTLQQDLFQV